MTPEEDKVLTWAVRTLKETAPPELPEGFLQELQSRLENEVKPSPRRRISYASPLRKLLAAVLFVAALGSLWLIREQHRPLEKGLQVISSSENPSSASAPPQSGPKQWSPGKTLTTQKGEALTILSEHQDERIVVGSSSRVTLKSLQKLSSESSAELLLERGSLFVSEVEGRITVSTARVKVTPLGTEYLVEHDEQATRITVFSGQVRVESLREDSYKIVNVSERLTVDDQLQFEELQTEPLLSGISQQLQNAPNSYKNSQPVSSPSQTKLPQDPRSDSELLPSTPAPPLEIELQRPDPRFTTTSKKALPPQNVQPPHLEIRHGGIQLAPSYPQAGDHGTNSGPDHSSGDLPLQELPELDSEPQQIRGTSESSSSYPVRKSKPPKPSRETQQEGIRYDRQPGSWRDNSQRSQSYPRVAPTTEGNAQNTSLLRTRAVRVSPVGQGR